ncbi:MAG: methionine synthase [Planctomycetes bacterium]|nr:methionine synthase [Planctomycetota bacterium]
MTRKILEVLKERILFIDGAMGTSIHARDLDLERDYSGLENCCEIINVNRPDVIRDIHASFLEVGCDAVETNTFGGMPHVLADFGLEDRTEEINEAAVRCAREAADRYLTPDKPRFVIGSMGPGTKLTTLDQIQYADLKASYTRQATALARAGVDAFLIETLQDPLHAKAVVNAALLAREAVGKEIPIFCSVTMEVTGTMLVGTEMAAAMALLAPYPIDLLSINCATGPREMGEHVRLLGQSWGRFAGCFPNAGLPQLVDGQPSYPLTPQELADWLERFVEEDGLNLVGGCCGTTPEHLAAVVKRIGTRTPMARKPALLPQITSIYHAVDLRQENSILYVGERSNANGSKQFRTQLLEGDLDGMVQLGRSQIRGGSHCLDVCTAYVGRDEVADMTQLIRRYRTEISVPLVLDTTEPPVLEAALQLIGGRSIINSINLEDGKEKCAKVLPLAREFGSAVIALTIDEQGMAKEVEEKVRIARRLHDICVDEYGLRPEDLLFDVLTFTVCTGNEDDRRHGINTLEGLKRVREELPGVGTLLGLSNISFGLRPAARHALNSVFLHHAQQAGLTAAILHSGRIEPLHSIAPEVRKTCEDLIFDRRSADYDPLHKLMELFDGVDVGAKKARSIPEDVFERLKWRIVEGEKPGLEKDLDLALQSKPALEIINVDLLAGMVVVGDLFGRGEMQLPFVLRSAETMKGAVAHLEPSLNRVEDHSRGKILLATVRGDVHDIGKNLVDIILTNNGYTVYNLGIKQPIEHILEVEREHRPDVIGMSGLLVKSTVIMRENLEEMNRRGITTPVVLGGAALTRTYVEEGCRATYDGALYYARDAFEGLEVMKRVMRGEAAPAARTQGSKKTAGERARSATEKALASAVEAVGRDLPASRPTPDVAEPDVTHGDIPREISYPRPPFLGPRIVEGISLQQILPYINETALFHFQWGYRRRGKTLTEHQAFIDSHVRPIFHDMVRQCEAERILSPKSAYGFWHCIPEGDTLVLLDPKDDSKEVARFIFPRQQGKKNLCITDFFHSQNGTLDVVGLQVVTIGLEASRVAREWFAEDRYQDYLHLHGLSVEAAEALAEYTHKQVRAELGIADEDARDMRSLFKQGYRGSRFSFGYPACPNMADQETLLDLLGADRIGIAMSDEEQLHPEQSTSALVCHHPSAKYFTI